MSGLDKYFGGYQTIQNDGAALPQQLVLNVIGGTLVNDAVNRRTTLTISGGGGSYTPGDPSNWSFLGSAGVPAAIAAALDSLAAGVTLIAGTGTNAFTGTGSVSVLASTQWTLGTGAGGDTVVNGFIGEADTTDGVTWVTIASIAQSDLPDQCSIDWAISFSALDVTTVSPSPLSGAFYRSDMTFTTVCDNTIPLITSYPSIPSAANVRSNGGGSTYAVQLDIGAGAIKLQVKGNASTTVHWSIIGQVQVVQ